VWRRAARSDGETCAIGAAIAVNDREGRTLVSWRFAATVAEGPAEMLERMAAEVLHLRAERADLPIVVIQDGAPELWRLIVEWEENFQIPITLRLVDRYHVDERLTGRRDPRAGQPQALAVARDVEGVDAPH
jgi:hypothetical protein